MSSKPIVPSAVHRLLAVLPDSLQVLTLCARDVVLAALPDATEIVDAKAKVIGYGYGAGYKDTVATLILSKTGVKIGLVEGASLADPAALLRGAGKVHRYIGVRGQEQLQRVEVRQLLEAALSAWRRRSQQKRSRIPQLGP